MNYLRFFLRLENIENLEYLTKIIAKILGSAHEIRRILSPRKPNLQALVKI